MSDLDNLPREEPTAVPEHTPSDDLNTASDKIGELLGDEGEIPEALQTSESDDEPKQKGEPQQQEPEQRNDAQEPLFTVRIDGKEMQVPQSELVNGYQRQADYTRKTQEIAQKNQAVDATFAQAQNTVRLSQQFPVLIGQLGALAQRMQVFQSPQYQQHEAELKANDPYAYLLAREEVRQTVDQFQVASGQLNAATEQIQKAETYRLANLTQEGHRYLSANLPDWKLETQQALNQFAQHALGYGPHEVSQVFDPRHVLTLRYAKIGYEYEQKKTQTVQRVQRAPPKVVRSNPAPESTDRRGNQAAIQRATKSGKLDDAAAAISSLLG